PRLVSSTPIIRSNRGRKAARAGAVGGSKSQPEPEPVRRIQGPDLIDGHQADGRRAEKTHAVQLAAVQEHSEEISVVMRRRQETGAAGETPTRTFNVITLPSGTRWRSSKLAGRIRRVDDGQSAHFFGRQIEIRVVHSQRLQDALAEKL